MPIQACPWLCHWLPWPQNMIIDLQYQYRQPGQQIGDQIKSQYNSKGGGHIVPVRPPFMLYLLLVCTLSSTTGAKRSIHS